MRKFIKSLLSENQEISSKRTLSFLVFFVLTIYIFIKGDIQITAILAGLIAGLQGFTLIKNNQNPL